jgi:hypothetical protein
MRQRNDSGHVVDVAAYPDEEHLEWRPFTVGPGEVVEFPELLGGFTEIDAPGDAGASAETDGDTAPAAAKSARKRAAAAPAPEGVDA